MPANKNALIRYKTIDNCLRNHYRRWTLDDLVEACSEALYDAEGITKGVPLRTVQSNIQVRCSDKLGYNAPIEVYKHKYYRKLIETIQLQLYLCHTTILKCCKRLLICSDNWRILKYSQNCQTSSVDYKTNSQFKETKENQLLISTMFQT